MDTTVGLMAYSQSNSVSNFLDETFMNCVMGCLLELESAANAVSCLLPDFLALENSF